MRVVAIGMSVLGFFIWYLVEYQRPSGYITQTFPYISKAKCLEDKASMEKREPDY